MKQLPFVPIFLLIFYRQILQNNANWEVIKIKRIRICNTQTSIRNRISKIDSSFLCSCSLPQLLYTTQIILRFYALNYNQISIPWRIGYSIHPKTPYILLLTIIRPIAICEKFSNCKIFFYFQTCKSIFNICKLVSIYNIDIHL